MNTPHPDTKGGALPGDMSAKYTPGPWQVSSWYSDAGRSCGISNGILGVASVYGMGRTETEANARLVANAPCMLAALKAILETSTYDDYPNTPEHKALERARAVFAKISGATA